MGCSVDEPVSESNIFQQDDQFVLEVGYGSNRQAGEALADAYNEAERPRQIKALLGVLYQSTSTNPTKDSLARMALENCSSRRDQNILLGCSFSTQAGKSYEDDDSVAKTINALVHEVCNDGWKGESEGAIVRRLRRHFKTLGPGRDFLANQIIDNEIERWANLGEKLRLKEEAIRVLASARIPTTLRQGSSIVAGADQIGNENSLGWIIPESPHDPQISMSNVRFIRTRRLDPLRCEVMVTIGGLPERAAPTTIRRHVDRWFIGEYPFQVESTSRKTLLSLYEACQ